MRILLSYILWLIPIALSLWIAEVSSAQPVIAASAPSGELKSHNTFDLEFSLSEPIDAYYFSVKIIVDPDVLVFQGVNESESMANSVYIADSLNPGEIGASITRTNQTSSNVSGKLISLHFQVAEKAPKGDSQIDFHDLELSNSQGGEFQPDIPESQSITILSGVSSLELETNSSYSVAEGEALDVSGRVFVNGITDEMDQPDERVSVWAAVNSDDSDPSEWSEQIWKELSFTSIDNGYHLYGNSIPIDLTAGNYFLALRARFDEGPFQYGGINDSADVPYWNGQNHYSADVEIMELPNFRYSVIEWTFENNSMLASSGLPQNRGHELHLSGANLGSFSTGEDGVAANATGWDDPGSTSKYWLAYFSTTNIQNIQVSSSQYSSGSGPSHMILQASLDGESWQSIDEGAVEIQSDWSSGELNNLVLDTQYEDRDEVYVRWIITENSRVSDGTEISAQGTSRIDNISITGENISPEDMTVWPGDTDLNSQVNEADVLPLGMYWLTEGPQPLFNSTSWEGRVSEGWIPAEATAADADGNGVVDHRDIKVIGLNFGNTYSTVERTFASADPVRRTLPLLKKGHSEYYSVEVSNSMFIQGISYQIEVSGMPADHYTIERPRAGLWSEEWAESDKLLRFYWDNSQTGSYSGAYMHKGPVVEKRANRLLTLKITAEKSWGRNAEIRINRLTVANSEQSLSILDRLKIVNISDSSEDAMVSEEDRMELVRIYPNPAVTESTIGFFLEEKMPIELELYDLTGRFIKSMAHGIQEPGYSEIAIGTNRLASGVYFIRLKGGMTVVTGKLMVLH